MPSAPPALFDAHVYPEGVNDQDLESMRFFGVEAALITPHYALPEVTARRLRAQWDEVVGVHLPRLERAGIRGYAALGVDPRTLPRRGLAEVLQALPHYFRGGKVVALGMTGLHRGGATEEEALLEQLALAKRLKLPVLLHTPERNKGPVTRRLLSVLRGSAIVPSQALVNHADGKTVRLIRECGHYAGLTLHPDALSSERAVAWVRRLGSERLVFNSEMGSGAGDLTSVARSVHLMARGKLSESVSARVRWKNAVEFLHLPA